MLGQDDGNCGDLRSNPTEADLQPSCYIPVFATQGDTTVSIQQLRARSDAGWCR